MPGLFITTGSNGAGKSSIGPSYLPPRIQQQGPVFDGDKLFVEKRKELWLFDRLEIIDSSQAEHLVLAVFQEGQPVLAGPAKSLPNWIQNYLPEISLKIEEEEVGRVLL